MHRDGFTLIETLSATALLTVALGMLWGAWISASDTAEVLDRKSAGTSATVRATARIGRELRMASRGSLSELPAAELTYRVPEDLDGNGLPVDGAGVAELGPPRRIAPDYEDKNGDGIRESQLVLETGGTIEVLANGLLNDIPDGDVAHRGIWFEASDGGVLVTVRVSGTTRRAIKIPAVASQQTTPRTP